MRGWTERKDGDRTVRIARLLGLLAVARDLSTCYEHAAIAALIYVRMAL